MIPCTTMAGREVALFGLGGSGMATARALREGGAVPIVWDDNPDRVNDARDEGLRAHDLRTVDWGHVAALVLAPGVPLTHPKPHWTVEVARGAGVEVIGDIELFCRERAAHCPEAPLIAITGTNGKSTTTALIAHVLREAGRDVQIGGNIGVPILELDPPSPDRAHVIECSSYQIDLAPGLEPSVGVLLNVTPDHLDRHGSFERYAAIKERLVAASAVAVIAVDGDATSRIAKGWRGRAREPVTISASGRPAAMVGHGSELVVRGGGSAFRPDGEDIVVADLATATSLRGRHNMQNALAAVAVGCALQVGEGFDWSAALASFPGLSHRMEQVLDHDGVIFVNDSKATNADAAAPALTSFERVHWIAGGLPKDGGIEPLEPHFGRVARAYLIGEAAPDFAATLGETVPYEIAGTLDVAVRRAAHDAKLAGGGVVLFSPAAASFDQFRNFEERGDAFREAVRAAVEEGDRA